MRKWRLVVVAAVVALAGVVGCLIAGQENEASASDTNALASEKMAAAMPGVRAVVVDITAPNMVTPKYHVVYDFEKKTVSLIMIQSGSNNDGIWVRQVTSYLTPTKEK